MWPFKKKPVRSSALIAEAKRHPNGYVYVIDGDFGPDEAVPPSAIVGAWKVDAHGELTEEYQANPNYRPRQHR